MEVKFDIVKPNLYLVGDEVYFGVDIPDGIQASRIVDEAITKHIGVLKVKKSNLEVLESGKRKEGKGRYDATLKEYLDVLERKGEYSPNEVFGITNGAAQLFDLGYVIDAQTVENWQDMNDWRALQQDLANPNEAFDRKDKESLVYRLDREETLEEMRRLHKELDPKILDNYADFVVITGLIPFSEQIVRAQYLGMICFTQLKAKDRTKIEEAKKDLTERLKEFDGPCLSSEAPKLCEQMLSLYTDAPTLIQKYGDVLLDAKSRMWRKRLFMLGK